MRYPPLLCLLVLFIFTPPYLYAEKTTPINEIQVLGINLIQANITSVRNHLWNIGGFLQAKSSVRQHNYDKFFPWSTMRDSYYILFRYNHAGKITSVKRLYRPYSTEHNNRRTAITTREVARSFIQKLGTPTQIQTKGWGGTLNYRAYIWQDEKITIRIDREGGEKLGNIFVQYTIHPHDPYEVVQTTQLTPDQET